VLSPRRTVALIAATALVGWAGGASARPRRFHRQQKDAEGEVTNHYSDRGAKPAKVALPQLTLRSRSLMGKDGATTVEISTAPFDVDAAPLGNISRVRIDAIDPDSRGKDDDKNDRKRFHKEYEHLRQGGYVSFKYTELPHGQALRIAAHGNGAVHREEVEGVLFDQVRYRPDLAVRDMAVPPTAAPYTAVFMSATVVERMGEVGASADCVTLVDGAQVDISRNVWVAANGVVTCNMAASFAPGKHTVTMRVQNVRPGDYDDSNNELSASIDVHPTLSYFAEASEHTSDVAQSQDCYMTSSSTTPEKHTGSDTKQTDQSRTVNGSVPLALAMPFSVSFSDSSGGRTLSHSQLSIDKPDLQPVAVDDPTQWTDQNSYSQDAGNGTVVTIIRYSNSNTNVGSTTVSFQMNATEVSYHSDNWCKNSPAFQCAGGEFSLPSDSTSGSGPTVQLANDYTVDLTLNDGTAYSAHAQAPLTVSVAGPTTTGSCFNRRFPGTDGTVGKMCNSTTVTNTTKDGTVSQ